MGRLTCANCAVQAIDSSCRSLGVEALDLVQFYWHDYSAPRYVGAAQRLADLQAAGRIRHIGVTNFDVPRLDEIVQGGVRVVSNQVRAPHRLPTHMQEVAGHCMGILASKPSLSSQLLACSLQCRLRHSELQMQ